MALRETLHRYLQATIALMLACVSGNVVAAGDITIHRYADFNQQSVRATTKSLATTTTTTTQRSQLNVYNKRFTLNLEDHSGLLGTAVRPAVGVALQRGSIEGIANSWVRLSRVKSGTHGLIWDGAELYAVEPTAQVRTSLDPSQPAPSGDTVIFKLSDTTLDSLGNYCASDNHADKVHTGMAMYQALADDLSHTDDNTNDDAAPPTLRLELQVVADAALRAQYDSDQDVIDALMVRLNNIDGIYSTQLGLAIEATNFKLLDAGANDLSSSADPNTLLGSLAQLRTSTPGMSTYAATHLFTGRDLDGDVLGIGYIGNLCDSRYATSLSEMRDRGAWLDSLVAAHELGHQLGAVHDGTGQCSDTPVSGYLMSAIINGADQFSACSRDSILATMHRAACLVPIDSPIVSGATGTTSNATNSSSGGGGGSFSQAWLLLLSVLAGGRLLLRREAA